MASAGAVHSHAYFEKLRGRLRLRLLIAYVVPLAATSVYFHYEYTSALRRGVDRHLASIADHQRNTVDLFLEERGAGLRQALRLEPLPPASAKAMARVLGELKAESRAIVDVGLFDPNGTLVSYAGPHRFLQGRSYQTETWFERVMASEAGLFIGDTYLGFRGRPHFIMAVTRDGPGGRWTLRASVDPREFARIAGRALRVERARAFIVNREGRKQTLEDEPSLEETFLLPPALDGGTVVAERSIGRRAHLSAIAPLRAVDWALVVVVAKKDAAGAIPQTQLMTGLLLLFSAVMVVALAFRSTARLVRRLEEADREKEALTRQLFDAAKLASVGEMAAGVAHEINNPLAIIYETAGVMKDTLDPAFGQRVDEGEFAEHLDVIEEATLRGRNITRQLLAFARKYDPRSDVLDVNLVVRRVLSIKVREFRVSNVSVVLELDASLPPVIADANQTEQVLLNLLNNACDAVGKGGRITLRTLPRGAFVEVQVEDNGRGMSHAEMSRAFFPFFTTKGAGRGTGLGLSISYGIVKAQGGRIEVESQVDVGTTVIVSLPAALRGEAGDGRAARRGEAGDGRAERPPTERPPTVRGAGVAPSAPTGAPSWGDRDGH